MEHAPERDEIGVVGDGLIKAMAIIGAALARETGCTGRFAAEIEKSVGVLRSARKRADTELAIHALNEVLRLLQTPAAPKPARH